MSSQTIRIIAFVVCALTAMMGEVSFWSIIRLRKFVNPFTYILMNHNVISAPDAMRIMNKEAASIWFSFIVWEVISLGCAYYTAPTGFYVYGIATVLSFIIARPHAWTYTPSPQNVEKYNNEHGMYMNEQNYMDNMQGIMDALVRGYVNGR